MKLTPPLIAVLTLYIAGCSRPAETTPDVGEIKNGTYHNRFFGFTVQLPADWKVADRQSLKDTGVIHLFVISQYDLADSPLRNTNLSCFTVNLPPDIRTGAEYLSGMKNSLPANVTIAKDIVSQQLGGRRFAVMRADLKKNNMTAHQVSAVTVIPGYALAFIGAYQTDDEGKAIDDVLQSIKFEK